MCARLNYFHSGSGGSRGRSGGGGSLVSFLLNLLILSATEYYLQGSDDIICKCTSASISVCLIMFIGILSATTLTSEWGGAAS